MSRAIQQAETQSLTRKQQKKTRDEKVARKKGRFGSRLQQRARNHLPQASMGADHRLSWHNEAAVGSGDAGNRACARCDLVRQGSEELLRGRGSEGRQLGAGVAPE